MIPADAQLLMQRLEGHDIRPSAQRVAIAAFVLATGTHPTADGVWQNVRADFPMLSRATVYNTLQLFAEKGLLRQFVLGDGGSVFDPNTEPHHHFIDDESGAITDIPWTALAVRNLDQLAGIDVRDYMVVVRGSRRATG